MPPECHAADDFGGRLDDRIISPGSIKNAPDAPPFEPNYDCKEKEQETGHGGKWPAFSALLQNATNANNSITNIPKETLKNSIPPILGY